MVCRFRYTDQNPSGSWTTDSRPNGVSFSYWSGFPAPTAPDVSRGGQRELREHRQLLGPPRPNHRQASHSKRLARQVYVPEDKFGLDVEDADTVSVGLEEVRH